MQINLLHKYTGHSNSVYVLEKWDESHFISAAGDGKVVKWHIQEPDNGILIANIPTQIFSSLCFQENNFLILGLMNGHLMILDLKQNILLKDFTISSNPIFALKKINNFLYITCGDGNLNILDLESLEIIQKTNVSKQALRCMEQDGNLLYFGASDGEIYVYSTEENKVLKHFPSHEKSCFSLLLHGNLLISGGRDAKIKFWNRHDFSKEPFELQAHLQTVNHLIKHNNHLVSASRDKTIKIWSLEDYSLKKVLEAKKHTFHLFSVNRVLSFDDKILISASDDKNVMSFEILNNEN